MFNNEADIKKRDFDWIREFQKGNKKGFDSLYMEYTKPLYFFVKRYNNLDEAQAEDICQEIMMSIYRNLANFQFKAKFTTYLYTVAVNQLRNVFRNKNNKSLSLDRSLDNDGDGQSFVDLLEDKKSDVIDDTVRKDLKRILLDGIKLLPEKEKEVFILKEFENMSFREIAEVTGGTLRNQQNLKEKANIKMQQFLKSRGIEMEALTL